MKKWKQYVSLVLALIMCLSMTACGGSTEETTTAEESEEVFATPLPGTIKDLVLDTSVEYDYSDYVGVWMNEDGSLLEVAEYEDGEIYFLLYDANDELIAGGPLQYVEDYHSVYAYNEEDGIAYLCCAYTDDTIELNTFGVYAWVDEEDLLPDLTGYTGYWKSENEPLYFIISDSGEWAAVNLYGEEVGPGYVVSEGNFITLCLEDGSEVISLWQEADGTLSDAENNILLPADELILLPTPEDELSETAYFSDDFANVSINYPIQMTAGPHPNVPNAVSLNAVMEDGTDDYYTNILLAFQPISGYDPYMEKGAATAEPYMAKMLDDFMNSMYGNYLLKSIGSDFEDKGDCYSITGYMWLDGSVFSTGDLTAPVRACMEVRYCGPTGYALVAITTALDSRIQNYYDICNNILETVSYDTGWSTAPKARPEQPGASANSGNSGDSGDYGTPYYWYDEDGDVWYWNGYENEFISYGSDGYIDSDSGEYMESNDAGWDDDDYYYDDYYDDYDPWSDPGDGDDAWSDPGDYYDDGWGDYFE